MEKPENKTSIPAGFHPLGIYHSLQHWLVTELYFCGMWVPVRKSQDPLSTKGKDSIQPPDLTLSFQNGSFFRQHELYVGKSLKRMSVLIYITEVAQRPTNLGLGLVCNWNASRICWKKRKILLGKRCYHAHKYLKTRVSGITIHTQTQTQTQ